MAKERFGLVGTVFTALMLISHAVWGVSSTEDHYEIIGDYPYLLLTDNTVGEAAWAMGADSPVNECLYIYNLESSTNPFIIENSAPDNSIRIKPDGKIGMGTDAPTGAIEVTRTGENVLFVVNRTDGARCGFLAKSNQFFIGTSTAHPVLIAAGNSWVTKFNTDGTLNMSDGGSYTGTWNDASSREYKENIQTLTAEEALEAFEGLNPVKYNYKAHKEEARLGFIAEDVPDLVAMNERKNLSTMDLMAVLTKVVQEQQKLIKEQQETISELNKRVSELESK